MQLRMVARRMSGSFTLLGDIAQATGAHAYDSWDDLLPHLPGGQEAGIEELEHAYRVPREIMDFSLPLLELIAPGTRPPRAYRTGAEPPRLVSTANAFAAGLDEAARLEDAEGLTAVIAPEALRPEQELASVFDETRLPVLTPREAKGLEFDHVVVVEPATIAAAGREGLRELYVALTRPTQTLVVTYSEPLPPPLG
jgi:DNA helicase IV